LLYIEIIKVMDLDVLPNAQCTQFHGKWAEKDRNFGVTLMIEPVFMRATREGVKIIVVLGGVMLALAESSPGRNLTKWMPESFLVRLFLAAGAVFLCVWLSRFLRLLSIRKEENRHLRNVTLFYAGQTIKTRGLIDTGNHLKAPVSGLPVHVATAGLMKRLCPAVKGVMYVPYQCIGSSGILPAVRIDEMKVEGEKGSFVIPKPWIAITKGSLSPHNEYEVLIQKNDKGLQV